MKYSAGFIGIGNMGGALASGVYKAKENIAVCDMDQQKCDSFINKNENAVACDIDTLAKESKFIFLGVKPDGLAKIATLLSEKITNETVLVSMAAAIELETIVKLAKTNKVIRIMPNTPAAVGEGMILYCAADGVTKKEEEEFLALTEKCGVADKLDQKFFDAAMALSGCGPAFCYIFAQSLADGAVSCGLPREKANVYAAQTLLGSAKMLSETKKHPEQLKDDVCSPGGTTIEGVLTLEKENFRNATAKAVVSAYQKAEKMKK